LKEKFDLAKLWFRQGVYKIVLLFVRLGMLCFLKYLIEPNCGRDGVVVADVRLELFVEPFDGIAMNETDKTVPMTTAPIIVVKITEIII